MEWLNEFIEWAWARHHNVLSWYIRPIFLIPFCYFAYHKSRIGIFFTIVGLITSMFWFPAPKEVSEDVIAMLNAEKEYLTGEWTIWKTLIALIIPLTFTALGIAFWKRSLAFGVLVINFMLIIKIFWTFIFAPINGAMAHLIPAVLGIIIINAIFYFVARKFKLMISFKQKTH